MLKCLEDVENDIRELKVKRWRYEPNNREVAHSRNGGQGFQGKFLFFFLPFHYSILS